MAHCVRCTQEAEFDVPELLCEYHWLSWVNEHLPPAERERQVAKDIALLHRNSLPNRYVVN